MTLEEIGVEVEVTRERTLALRPGPTALSMRTIVGSDTADAFASTGWLQLSNPRAALICAAVSIS
jgi:hypothetical protein